MKTSLAPTNIGHAVAGLIVVIILIIALTQGYIELHMKQVELLLKEGWRGLLIALIGGLVTTRTKKIEWKWASGLTALAIVALVSMYVSGAQNFTITGKGFRLFVELSSAGLLVIAAISFLWYRFERKPNHQNYFAFSLATVAIATLVLYGASGMQLGMQLPWIFALVVPCFGLGYVVQKCFHIHYFTDRNLLPKMIAAEVAVVIVCTFIGAKLFDLELLNATQDYLAGAYVSLVGILGFESWHCRNGK